MSAPASLTATVPGRSRARAAWHIAEQVVYGPGDDYFEHFAERIAAVDASAVQQAAEQYLHPEQAVVVVVADGSVEHELALATEATVTRVAE